jgi:phosphatidate cytidylyltransferase
MTAAARWADLKVRVASAAVLIVLGIVQIYVGGLFFLLVLIAAMAAMIWELAGLDGLPTDPVRLALAALAGLCLWAFPLLPYGWGLLALPTLGFLVTPHHDRLVLAAYALALMLAGAGFLDLRAHGAGVFAWLVAVVVASDTMGYFVGRLVGGPKFWPSVSPKKTWSGTAAGWCGAAVVGVIFAAAGVVPWSYAILSPLIALAGQFGDIAESWIKRRAGAKDSSHLIPGHGGVMDRFDALVGAVLALQALGLLLAGPV